jgi:hypothetical protein
MRLGLALVLSLLVLAAPAGATFTPVTAPFGAGVDVRGFAVSGDRWLALDENELEMALSVNGGSWAPLAQPGGATADNGVAVAPDGAFVVPFVTNSGTKLYRLPVGSTTWEPMPVGLAGTSVDRYSPPAWDEQGRMWITLTENAGVEPAPASYPVTLARIEPDGSVAEQASATVAHWATTVHAVGGALWIQNLNRLFRLESGTLADKGLVGAPVSVSGQRVLSQLGLSLDGGETFRPRLQRVVGAANDSGLALTGGDLVAERDGVLLPVDDAPNAANALWKTTTGHVALKDISLPATAGEAFATRTGAIPGWQEAQGAVTATSLVHVRRVNELRAAAGLPLMTADQLVEQAAGNHSRYWTLNPMPSDLSIHDETPGLPGFTGVNAWDRCLAVGAPSCAEVIFPGVTGAKAMDGFAATPYHGALAFEPGNHLLGGSEIGPTTTNFTQPGVALEPVAFPRGTYDADRGFFGESPDPVAACAQAGFAVGYPVGAAQTFQAPEGFPVSDIRLYRAADSSLVPGCKLLTADRAQYLPDDPLAPNAGYRVEATWQPSATGLPQIFAWEFQTTARDTTDYTRGTGPGPADDGPPGGVATPGVLTTSGRVPLSLKRLLRRGLTYSVRCSLACVVKGSIKQGARTLGSRRVTRGQAGKFKITVRISKRAARKLRRKRALRAKLVTAATFAAGQTASTTRRFTFRR